MLENIKGTSLTSGDFLLDGRDQVVLTATTFPALAQTSLRLDLIEYKTAYPLLLPASADSSNVGSAAFDSPFALQYAGAWYSLFAEGYFTRDVQHREIKIVRALSVDAGDVVDSAADELVVHLMFQNDYGEFGNPAPYPVLGQRLLHFDTTRDGNNLLTGIALGGSNGADSNRIVEYYDRLDSVGSTPVPPAIDATIANVDGVGKAEILLTRAGRDLSGFDDIGELRWWAHPVDVRLQAAFRYRNIGARAVAFTNHALGDVQSVLWDFGDGQTSTEATVPVFPDAPMT